MRVNAKLQHIPPIAFHSKNPKRIFSNPPFTFNNFSEYFFPLSDIIFN